MEEVDVEQKRVPLQKLNRSVAMGMCGGKGPSGQLLSKRCGHNVTIRDDAFSDSLSQKADSEASSGPLLDDKASSKNDLQSPTEHISDYGFGGVMGR
ncbi:hypothetical protein P7K49_030795 [Saguinus oedipus]|uniref:Uncharacterized protein n=1 Tax=Saguinus oedipus TaxID=9490 RepID=A0ABQ9U3B4_SAGOE|nr:hypothetical protein P7K49_030795 [Saguinus oedipus]